MTKWLTPWEDLQPTFAAKVLCGLATLEHNNVDVVIPPTGGKRTDATQIALYAQGRTKPGDIVTNCDGVKIKSKHQLGLAVDIVPADSKGDPSWPDESDPRWKVIRDAMVEQGLLSGQDWPEFKDMPHIEARGV
jgi:peptidoglycan L-alanyl-D-glutamate endopeptidase CwlK